MSWGLSPDKIKFVTNYFLDLVDTLLLDTLADCAIAYAVPFTKSEASAVLPDTVTAATVSSVTANNAVA